MGQLIRYFLRSKLAKFAQQVNEVAREQEREQKHASRPKDEVIVDYVPKTFKEKSKKDVQGGDYVDYEEVKE